MAPGRGAGGALDPVPIARAAELASLRQSSPLLCFETEAPPHPKARGRGPMGRGPMRRARLGTLVFPLV